MGSSPFLRRPRVEPLEDRRLLSITVNTVNDIHVNGKTTLREAIAAAMPGETIDFAASLTSGGPATITLTQGELTIDKNLTISGPGANLLTIDASGNDPTPTMNNGDGSRVFNFDDGNLTPDKTVSISGLTLTGGDEDSAGGGIITLENLVVTQSTITGNSTGDRGGGIGSFVGSTLTISDSTISGNSADTFGGGIASRGDVTVLSSTISGNFAGIHGGGIASYEFDFTLASSTISGNSAGRDGGGIYLSQVILTVSHSTITGNRADLDNNANGSGGGIRPFNSVAILDHTIVAGNFRGPAARDDISGSIAAGDSFIGDDTGMTLIANFGGNLFGTGAFPADPLLGPLSDNGGPTLTHAPLHNSPVIDAGNPDAMAGVGGVPLFDQRGEDRVTDGDGFATARIDIGAVEAQPITLVVDTLVDLVDGNYSVGNLSLREAILLTNANVAADTIMFDPALTSGGPAAIMLSAGIGGGAMTITDSVSIEGPGATLLTIDASSNDPTPAVNNGDGSRLFRIDDGDINTLIGVELIGLTLTGGDSGVDGGAIFNTESLSITASTISGNSATGASVSGGGIYSTRAVIVTSSTISGNSASDEGGGIYSFGGTLFHVTDSTINNNSADTGGGISSRSFDTLINASTISGNTAEFGGGIYGRDIFVRVTSTTVSGNSATGGGGIWNELGNLIVTGSTISGNTVVGAQGGGIISRYGTAYVTDSTISGNMTNIVGGGIFNRNGNLTVTSSTISGNSAGSGGGIYKSGTGTVSAAHTTITANHVILSGGGLTTNAPSVALDHTIVAGNIRGVSTRDDVSGAIAAEFSLIGDNTGATITNNGGNLIGTGASPINPQLGTLGDNGGPTKTHGLKPISPALDAGDPAAVAGMGGVPAFDQRGAPFARVFDGNGIGGARIDMGAFELQPVGPALLGDYNQDDFVNAADYVVWRKTLGTTGVPAYSGADGDGDTTIDPDDYGVWTANFGETVQPGAASEVSSMTASGAAIAPVDESTGSGTSMRFSVGKPNQTAEPLLTNGPEQAANRREYPPPLLVPVYSPFAPYRPALRGSLSAQRTIGGSQRDEALVAWLASYSDTMMQFEDPGAAEMRATEDVNGADVINFDSFEQVFAQLASD